MPRQRGGRKLIYGTLGFLLFAGVVVVIVLASLGYFNKKGSSSPSPGPSPGPVNPTLSMPVISNLIVQPGPTGYAPTGLTFSINSQPCFGTQCSTTLDVRYVFKDGTTYSETLDITNYTEYTIPFGDRQGISRVPSSVDLTAYSTLNGIKGPISNPVSKTISF